MDDKDGKSNESEKEKKIDSSPFELRRKRFNIQADINQTLDITSSCKTLIYGFMRDNIGEKSSLYSTILPIELLLLIYSFYQRLIIHFGLRFYYWPYYKSIKQLSNADEEDFNINDHSGYSHSIYDLFITPKYRSFKEEIMSYKIINILQQYKNITMKVNNCLMTTTVKKMKSDKNESRLKYDIFPGAAISFEHLLSLVLFTDLAQLCVDFKNSFCPATETETLEDVKTRNSNYFWMSKCLREVVEVFGISRRNWESDTLKGPFFACSAVPLTVSEFNVRICLPMSSSCKLEVVKSFAGPKGMILQFNNPKTYQYGNLKGFDCSFISKCPQESEIIFFGGQYYIKLENVIMMTNDQDLQKYVTVLSYLDIMLTGGSVGECNIDDSAVQILTDLFICKLGKKTADTVSDYVYSIFSAFTQRKGQIVLDLDELYSNAKKEMNDLIMYKLKRNKLSGKLNVEEGNFENLFRPQILQIFENINVVIIIASGYVFSFILLLSLIKSTSVRNVVVKAECDRDRGVSWLSSLWRQASSSLMQQQFKQNNYSISFKKERGSYGDESDCVIIEKY